jgi:putative PIN family toxin of toxin-antitoxin system
MDTDVLVAGLRSRTGASWILLLAADAGVIRPLITVATMLEYEAVLTRSEQLSATGFTYSEVDTFLDDFVGIADEISPHYNHHGMIRDPNDEKFLAAAINGMADALVTFNIRDYVPLDGRITGFGINVCRPGDILRSMSWRPSVTSRFGSLPH